MIEQSNTDEGGKGLEKGAASDTTVSVCDTVTSIRENGCVTVSQLEVTLILTNSHSKI